MRNTITAFLLSVALFSCNRRKEDVEHRAYFDQVFRTADSLSAQGAHLPLAFAYIDSMTAAMPGAGTHDLWRAYDYKRGSSLQVLQPRESEKYADSMMNLIRERTSDYQKSRDYYEALLSKGDALLGQHDYDGAFRCYAEALRLAARAGDTCTAAHYSTSLGSMCYRQSKFRDAIRYFLESYDELQHCQDEPPFEFFVNQQGTLDNVALGYTGLGYQDSALFYYDSARRFITVQGSRFIDNPDHANFINCALGVVSGNEGDVWRRTGDTAKAIAAYEDGIDRNMHRWTEIEDGQITGTKLVGLYVAANRLPEAGRVLAQVRQSIDSFPHPESRMLFYKVSRQYNDKAGHTQDAYRDLLAYNRLKDSIEGGKPVTGVDIEAELQHVNADLNLRLLQREDELKSLYLLIAAVFVGMALVITYLVFQNGRRSRQHLHAQTLLNQRITTQNRQMHNTLTALEQSHRENDRFLKVLAHDLRNPIGASDGLAAIVLEEVDMDPEHRQMMEHIRASARQSLDMINDLLRSHTFRENLITEPVDLKAVLQYCAGQMETRAGEKNQRIVVEAEPIILPLNREKLWRVVSNLVANAIKFSHPGSTITLSLYREDDEARISVRDEGIGIPEAMQGSLFDLPQEARRTGTAGEESFGLGLGIAKQIVEALGGRIWFETQEGRGTMFLVAFPYTIST